MNVNSVSLNENLCKILDYYRERSGILKECLNISLKIKEEGEKNIGDIGDISDKDDKLDVIDIISELTDKREVCLQKIKNTDATIHHYRLRLPDMEKKILKEIKDAVKDEKTLYDFVNSPNYSKLYKTYKTYKTDSSSDCSSYVWVGELYNILENDKNMLNRIKSADEINFKIIKSMLEEIKSKVKSIRGNRILMNKFIENTGSVSLGTLMNKKK